MTDGEATVHTAVEAVREARREIAEMEGVFAEMVSNLERLRPSVVTAQRLTEMRTAIAANAGFRIKHDEILDLITVATKVLYLIQQAENANDKLQRG